MKLNASNPIVEANGTMTQLFREWALQQANALVHVGTGSPEGVLEAPQYSLYLDESNPAAPVQYRKMLPEIAGNRDEGWYQL